MFEEHKEIVNRDIATIRSIIETNNHLREILFSKNAAIQQSLKSNQELMNLKELVPDDTTWKVYDHCSVVTRLYSIHENFIEKLIRSWINYLPEIYLDYSDLPETIRNTHSIGVGNLLLELRKEKSRFGYLSIEEVMRGLYLGITNKHKRYDLIAEAFLMHQQNLRKDAIQKLFTDAGIPESWNWIKGHQKIKRIVEDIDNTAEGQLAELISYRNDAAHGGEINEVLKIQQLLNLCQFIEYLCEAILNLVNFHIVERKKALGKVQDIGSIINWLNESKVAITKIKNANLFVGEKIWLISQRKSYYQYVTIENIRITIDGKDVDRKEIKITDETDVALKLNDHARRGLNIYKEVN